MQIALACNGPIANIDHSPALVDGLNDNGDLPSLAVSPLIRMHRQMANWVSPEGKPSLVESFTYVDPGPFIGEAWGDSVTNTTRDVMYLHILSTPLGKTGMPADRQLRLSPLDSKVLEVVCLNSGQQVAYSQREEFVLDLSAIEEDEIATILKIRHGKYLFRSLHQDVKGAIVNWQAIRILCGVVALLAANLCAAAEDEALAATLKEELQQAGVACGVPLVTENGDLPYGVEWRSAELEGQPVVNIVNLTRNPITERLPSGKWQDLIARQPLPLDITLQPNTPVLAQGTPGSATISGQVPKLDDLSKFDILPEAMPSSPSYQALSQGPLKVRLFPGQTKPCLQHYINLNAGPSSSNYIAALQRDGLSGSWAMMNLLSSDGLRQFIETDRPICCYFTITPVQNHQLESNAPMLAAMDYVEKNHKGFYTYGVCEWENSFFRHWEKETDTTAIYGATPAELSRMDRKGNYDVLELTARRWKQSVRGRMMMANGYGMLSHLADIGLDGIGIETSETIPATQVKRAFARGAARQFEIPWFEEVSVWFGASVSGGMPKSEILPYWPNTPVGGAAGHSPSHLMRHWFTSWFSGANHILLEASPQVLYEVPWSNEFPENARLSPYGKEAQRLAALMNSVDIGVPYTPFAILMNKYHGRWSVWGKPWGRLEETPGDKMTERFFDQLFPGQSQGPGREERYLCSSPYGDTVDVLVNNAARSSWQAYPVILAVGDIPWTSDEIQFLKGYVNEGGILALNEIHMDGWGRAYLGLASEGFAPTADAQAVLKSSDGNARLIRRDIGQGCVLVSSRNPEPARDQELAFPDELLVRLAEHYLPFKIEGDVQTLINRTKDGWALMIVNNKGITKELHVDHPPVIDASATQRVGISFQGTLTKVSELIDEDKIRIESIGAGDSHRIWFDLPPGEIRLIKIDE